ncbi:MAG TPA: HlyD family efflux transporter periplasmic adaptor subunit [Balneolaceae bacterium]|nr:HlyD family efflux transporter periplasmic adaptor subunit [Balneolaceae bacterium]
MKKKYLLPAGLLVLVLIFWMAFGVESSGNTAILVSPRQGEFNVTVTTTGELRAQKSIEIMGPRGIREIELYRVEIQKLVPEGTIVEKGDFVAELNRSEIMTKLKTAQLDLDQVQSQVIQARLDSSLTLSEARNEIINLRYAMEEAQLAVKQSKYESPAVQRQRQIDYEQAERRYNQAKENYITRQKQAEAELSEVEAELQKKQNDVQKIQNLMKEFTIYAPESGMVIYERDWNGRKQVEGSTISAWNPVVAELPDFNVMESVTYVNEVDIQQIEEGQQVDVGLDAMPEKNLTGIVTDVANIGIQRPNSDAKVYEVIIEIQESDSTLRPAMTTSNLIHISSFPNTLYLPLETVHVQDSTSFIYTKEDGNPVMRQVIIGQMNSNNVVILEGAKPDYKVYLSIPADTSGIEYIYLPEKVVLQYKGDEKASKPVSKAGMSAAEKKRAL